MPVHDMTKAAPQGLRGGDHFPARRADSPPTRSSGSSRWRGTVIWAVVASTLTVSAVAFGAPVTSFIYGIDDSSQLWVMGLSGTGSATSQLLGTTTLTGSSANALAYDRGREQLFAVDAATSQLYWWQQGATNYTVLGSLASLVPAVGEPVSAAYYDNAYWFIGNGSPGNQLTKLTVTYSGNVPTSFTGTTYTIGGMPTSPSGGGDMVVTPGGIMYAYSAPGVGNFFTADLTSIVSGTVGGYSSITTTSGTALQLALGVDNATLYGHDFVTAKWYVVDTSNGSTTEISGLTTPKFRDLGGASIQAVPEPSTLVLAAVGGGLLAWQASRRRRPRGSSPDAAPESAAGSSPDGLDDTTLT